MENKQKILTDENLLEKDEHGSDDYRFSYYYEDIWAFDLHCVDWHWHPEVEFVYFEKGGARIYIGSEQYEIHESEGLFINSQVIHRFEVDGHTFIPNIVFSPLLLASEDSLIYKKYIAPVIGSSVKCQIFNKDIPWQNNVITALKEVFRTQESGNIRDNAGNAADIEDSVDFVGDTANAADTVEIDTLRFLLDIWHDMYINMDLDNEPVVQKSDARTQANLQIMMQYIHSHYREKILLEDIAGAVNLSKSTALNIFNNCLHISPVNYLIRYRLRCAAKLLKSTENSIAYIAEITGFENIGYFCRKFKGLYNMTPTEYRKENAP